MRLEVTMSVASPWVFIMGTEQSRWMASSRAAAMLPCLILTTLTAGRFGVGAPAATLTTARSGR
jgi:hypothetical protein